MVRTKQGGSVLSFVVVASILVIVLIAGVYMVRHLNSQSETPLGPSTPAPSSSSHQSTSSSSASSSQSTAGTSAPQSTPANNANSSTGSPASQLPHTGPGGILGTVIALGALSMTVVSYARSRRLEMQL